VDYNTNLKIYNNLTVDWFYCKRWERH